MSAEEGNLDKLLYSTIQDLFSWPRFGVELVVRRLADLGISLTDTQIDKLRSDLEDGSPDKLLVDLSDEQAQLFRSAQPEDSNTLDLNVGDLTARLGQSTDQVVLDVLQTVSSRLLDGWKQQAEEILAEQLGERSELSEKVYDVWGTAIDRLDMLVSVCMEEGARFNDLLREEAAQAEDLVFEALTRLHARGCQVGFEVLTLLRSGFADGAHARWRTLHELAVVAMFIAEHGQGVAQRYLEHFGIIDYWEAKAYKRHCEALGYPPLSREEMERVRQDRDSLIERHGKDFDKLYGWTANVLPKGERNFAGLEKSVNLDHLRPFYKLANINVHAGPKGGYFRIGLPPQNDSLLLAGPSIFGLAEPGQNTAVSIQQLTLSLLLLRPNLDRLAFAQAIQLLLDEVFVAFAEAYEELESMSAG